MKRKCSSLLAGAGFASSLLISAPALAQVLGTASNFAVLGHTPNVSNVGPSVVTGSVGIDAAAAIIGFPPGIIVPGTGSFQAANAVALQAQNDNTAAFGVLTGLASAAIPAALGGQTLGPGVYRPLVGDFNLTGTLHLTVPGLYVFQTPGALITSAGGTASVDLGTASPCDVWWTVVSSATIDTGAVMAGNILASTSIVIKTGASLQGRALVQTGTVTLDTNAVTACTGGTAAGFIVPALAGGVAAGAIPTLSEWGMIILAALLALFGFAAVRRQAR